MKQITLALTLLFSLSAFADIEAMPGDRTQPSAKEIAASRACFEEVIKAGCKHPKEDQTDFRSCMSSVHGSLTTPCQKMMTELYGKQ